MVPLVLRLKTILVPIDFSVASEKALTYAVPFAKQFGARITLLHVFHAEFYANEFAYLPTHEEAVRRAVEERLTMVASRRSSPEILEQTLVRRGLPSDQIVNAAKELKADLIVLNTHGYTGLKHILMGSTAECVVRHAPCPVLVVREREH